MRSTGYEPLNEPKPLAPDIWIVDGPHIRLMAIPFPTRATIVRLEGGGLWVHSPTALDDALRAQIDDLGPVEHLIAPNWIHYAYLPQWQDAYPGAATWAAPGVAERAAKTGTLLRINFDLVDHAPDAWAGQIEQLVVKGSNVHREAVFFHRASGTLILTDLIENFEPRYLPIWMRPIARLAGIAAPNGAMPRDMRMTFRGNEALLRADVEQMIGWAPERIVISHGQMFETGAAATLRRAFAWVL